MTLFCIQSLTLFQMNSNGSHIAPSQTSHLCQYHIAALETSDQSLGGGNSQRDGMRYIHCSDWVLEHCRMRAKPFLLRGGWRVSSALSIALINILILVGAMVRNSKGKFTLIWKDHGDTSVQMHWENKQKQLPCQPVSNDFYTQYKLSHGGKGSWNKVFIHIGLQL